MPRLTPIQHPFLIATLRPRRHPYTWLKGQILSLILKTFFAEFNTVTIEI